ncbi:MAG: cupin domain-containing protein [Defluviitaleaceae bacterium]|nr:cupin domain-containing protein [Defluviitaleaceae bacterium]
MNGDEFMIKLKSEMQRTIVNNLRGGEGSLTREDIFTPEEALEKTNMIAVLTIPDGSSIGEHIHGPEAEMYYILSGTLRVTDNGITKDLVPGDAVFTGGGTAHSVVNMSGKEASMLAIIIK